MSVKDEEFTVGVEEEYQIIHPETRELRSRSTSIRRKAEAAVADNVQPELYLSQIEIGTDVCHSLGEVRQELTRLRREVIAAAERDGSRIAAAGTHPFSHWEDQRLTPKDRYFDIAGNYAQLAREHLIFGCHVHVGIRDREAAMQVMNRARPWLAPLLALAANSPFWLGVDTGYASFRTEIWRRWPFAGSPMVFESRAEYDGLIETLVAVGSISDATKIYWDVRPSARFETLEFRATDVCLTIDEAVMVAGLVRGLARTCYEEAERNTPFAHARPELIRAAKWRAARFGASAELIDVERKQLVPARQLFDKMLRFLRPALEEFGEWDEVSSLVENVLARGTGAERQRGVFARANKHEEVVDYLVAETAMGTG